MVKEPTPTATSLCSLALLIKQTTHRARGNAPLRGSVKKKEAKGRGVNSLVITEGGKNEMVSRFFHH